MPRPRFARRSLVLALALALVLAACGEKQTVGPGGRSIELTPGDFAAVVSPSARATTSAITSATPRASPAASGVVTATAIATRTPGASPTATVTRTPSVSPTGAAACDEPSAVARVRPSVVRIEAGDSTGTGIVAAGNLVVTAEHVVRGVQTVRLTLADGRRISASVTARRQDQDLALLRAETGGLTVATWGDESALRPGQGLLALGYARDIPGEPSLTGGRFSARRVDGGVTLVQTDTPLNPGNSGGPLFTQCGEVVGVVSFGLTDAQGLNFAVAASHARALAGGPSPSVRASGSPAPSARPSPSPTPSAAIRVNDTVATRAQTGCVNLRATPARTADVVACVENGTRYTVIGGPRLVEGEEWFQLRNPTVGTGWSLGQFLVRP